MSAQRGVDVAKVAALEGAECDDCGMPDHACECYMFDRDDDALDDDFCECGVWPCSCAGKPLTAPALEEDAPRPWEALRRQLDAIEAERRGRP